MRAWAVAPFGSRIKKEVLLKFWDAVPLFAQ
jgi:hypothetical protein